MPDLDHRIRSVIETARPVTLDEVLDRPTPQTTSQRASRWPQQAAPVLVAAAVAAAVLVAVHATGHHSPSVSVTGPSGSTSPVPTIPATTPPTSPAPSLPPTSQPPTSQPGFSPGTSLPTIPSVVDATTPPLPGCVPATNDPPHQWRCPASPALGRAITGAPVPDPTVPAGFVPAYTPIFYVAPGPIADGAYQRAWAPAGTFPPQRGATGPYLELRVHAHQPDGWGEPFTHTVELANGTEALIVFPFEFVDQQHVPTSSLVETLSWSHAGLDYELETAGVSPADILAAANSLP